MKALNRALSEWFQRVETGQLALPRFQRFEAWTHAEVAPLLQTVLRDLPAGATLVLDVGDHEKFVSRPLRTAPELGRRPNEHLLDGQQRLTALWRALHDNYHDRTYYFGWWEDEDGDGEVDLGVYGQPRWVRNGVRYPRWSDDPRESWLRNVIPVRLLKPGSDDAAKTWSLEATRRNGDADHEAAWTLDSRIAGVRSRAGQFNLPYLSLPAETSKSVALEVFVKLNTSSVRLTTYDIVVAQYEEATGKSLHEVIEEIHADDRGGRATRYADLGTLVLDIACLLEDRPPNKSGYLALDLPGVRDRVDEIREGLALLVEVLEEQRIFDAERLPTTAILAVIGALATSMPTKGDDLGNARALLRAYVWRASLTRRYEQSVPTRELQDYRGLRDAIAEGLPLGEAAAPIFDEAEHPLPSADDLVDVRWPRTRDVRARGVLAVTLRSGGRDIADDHEVTAANVVRREYHHLFPNSLLAEIGQLETYQRFRGLNCALISWGTNRTISNKSPVTYLRDRVDRSHLGEDEVRRRVESHLVPYDLLASAGPYTKSDANRLRADYDAFLRVRAQLVAEAGARLARGVQP